MKIIDKKDNPATLVVVETDDNKKISYRRLSATAWDRYEGIGKWEVVDEKTTNELEKLFKNSN